MKNLIRPLYLVQWRALFSKAQLYLPLLVLLGLAGVTYFLVQQTSVQKPPIPPLEVGEPDFFATNFYLLSYGNGNKAVFTANHAQHFLHADAYSLEGMQTTIWQKANQITHASSDTAWMNHSGSEIKMIGAARLEQQKPDSLPMHLKGAFLHLFLDQKRITSNQPVLFTQGKDRISANQMEYDQNTEFLQLNTRVRATLYPNNRQP